MDLNTSQTIYVKLLGEGTEVYRPVFANRRSLNIYEINEQFYEPEDEHWEFPPRSVVLCETREIEGNKVLIAIKLA